MHKEHLEANFGVGPHTISVPRIRPADDISVQSFPDAIDDQLFKKIVAILRITVPTPASSFPPENRQPPGKLCWT